MVDYKLIENMDYKINEPNVGDTIKIIKLKENFIEGEDYQECRYDLKECDEDSFLENKRKPPSTLICYKLGRP